MILMKNVKTEQEVEYLLKIVRQLTIFQNQPGLLGNISGSLIQKSFTLQYYPKNTVIFRRGDIGYNFYIILKGSVATLIPSNKQKINSISEIVRMMTMGSNEKFKNLASLNKKNNLISQFKNIFSGTSQQSASKHELDAPSGISSCNNLDIPNGSASNLDQPEGLKTQRSPCRNKKSKKKLSSKL